MKKKIIIILLIIAALSLIAFIIWKATSPKSYDPETLEAEVFNDKTYDTDLFIGLWQSGSVYYRYNDDFTGGTWDTADDVMESEASKFTWEVNRNRLIHFHEMEIGGIIPKAHTIKNIDLGNLEYQDDFGEKFVFVKVD